MPLYDYECAECNYTEERLESIHEKSKICKCPNCKKKKFRRVVNTAPMGAVVNIVTVGQLAERNWRSKGNYEKTELMEQERIKEKSAFKDKLTKHRKRANEGK